MSGTPGARPTSDYACSESDSDCVMAVSPPRTASPELIGAVSLRPRRDHRDSRLNKERDSQVCVGGQGDRPWPVEIHGSESSVATSTDDKDDDRMYVLGPGEASAPGSVVLVSRIGVGGSVRFCFPTVSRISMEPFIKSASQHIYNTLDMPVPTLRCRGFPVKHQLPDG